jgi:hypothetical protein
MRYLPGEDKPLMEDVFLVILGCHNLARTKRKGCPKCSMAKNEESQPRDTRKVIKIGA